MFILNLKHGILSQKQLKGGIYVFQEFFQGKDFDSTLKVLQFVGISLCHWVIILLIINRELYI